MKKAAMIIGIGLAFLLGLMLFDYMAEPVSRAGAEDIPAPPAVSARKAILMDAGTGEVLYEKNADEKAFPASTTKIMTALVTLELCRQYDISIKEKVVIPKAAEGVEGSSLYLKAGEEKTIKELLYGVMLRSGNDGAAALAEVMGGNTRHFLQLMNEKAKSLGCTGTHFTNPSGLPDEEHYTTARDLAQIACCAMKNRTFRKIVSARTWKEYTNKNKTVFQYEGATGIKIGFTKQAGRTLVASARRQDTELICVVLNDGDWFNDAYRLLDYGFQVKGCADEE